MDTMDVKGQASVEYLLLALVFLIIIGSVSVPLIGMPLEVVWMFHTLLMQVQQLTALQML